LLLENFVHPQTVLQLLIDERFSTLHCRVQLELLAICTATLIEYRQTQYDHLDRFYSIFTPMLLAERRDLRHGGMECVTMMCAYLNGFKPISDATLHDNPSIVHLLSYIDRFSTEVGQAVRFRLQRNLLPQLTAEGNIIPGLVCQAHSPSDPDVRLITAAHKSALSSSNSSVSMDDESLATNIPAVSNANTLLSLSALVSSPFLCSRKNTTIQIAAVVVKRKSEKRKLPVEKC
jgi:hypothetical protein